MSFLKKVVKAATVGALVYMTGGLAAAAIGIQTTMSLGTLAALGATMGGLSVVSAYLAAPKANKQQVKARLNLSVDANSLGKIIYGETALATDVVYHEKIGDTKVLYIVAAAWHEIDQYTKLYIDDEEIQLDSSGRAQGEWADVLQVYTRRGTFTQDAITFPFANGWPAAAKGSGIAHYAMVFDASSKNGQKKLANGVPSRITFVAKGAKVYDPRKDSTLSGFGTQRVDDQSTWGFSENWALIVANYLLGYRQNGKLVYGVGVDPADIDWAQVGKMADVCDTIVDGKPKYKIGGILEINNDHEQNIAFLESAVDGKVAKLGGKYFIWCPHDDTSEFKLVIEDSDIVSAQGISYSPTKGLETLYNTARGQYVSPASLYQLVSYPEVNEPAALAEDGKPRILAYDFTMIQDPDIVQRVARERIRRSRYTGSVSFLMGPRYIALKPFDIVTLKLKETNGAEEFFRVISITGSVNGFAQLELIEEDPSIYDVSVPLGPSLLQLSPDVYDPTQEITPVNVAASNVVVQGTESAKDAIRVTWNDAGAFVRETELRWRVDGSGEDYTRAMAKFSTSTVITPVEPSTVYDIQVRHITREGVISDWVQIVHTSGNKTVNVIRIPQLDSLLPGTEFVERLNTELDTLNQNLGGVDGLLEQVAQDINEVYQRTSVEERVRQAEVDTLEAVAGLVDQYLLELEGETLPELNSRLTVAEGKINQLNTVALPAVNASIAAVQSDIVILNSNSLPNLQNEIDAVEAAVNQINTVALPAVSAEIANVNSAVNQINAVTIPAVNSNLVQAQQEINQLNQTTIPSIAGELSLANQKIDQLEQGLNPLTGGLQTTIDSVLEDVAQDINEIIERSVDVNNSLNAIRQVEILFPIRETSIDENAITTPKIAANAVTALKIAALAVTADKIAANAVTADKIAANAVTAINITSNAITADKIVSNAVIADKIAANAVSADKIAANAVTAEKINALAVTAAKIAAGAVTAEKIDALAVTAAKIAAGAVVADKIATNAVTAEKIDALAVTADKIAANAVTAAKIAAGAVSADKIAANTITAAQIAALTITGAQIAANSIAADKLVANTITAAQIAAGAIGADQLAANSVSAAKIVAGSITGDKIAARTIVSTNLVAGTITGTEIAARTIGAVNIAADSLTSTEIKAGSITGDRIAAFTITGDKIAARTIDAGKLTANSITAAEIAALTITANELAANSIISDKIAANAITADKIAANSITGDKIVAGTSISAPIINGGQIIGVSGSFSGTVQAQQIVGDIYNVKRITNIPASNQWWNQNFNNTTASKRRVLNIDVVPSPLQRIFRFENLAIGFGAINQTSGASGVGTVYAQLPDGTVLKTWSFNSTAGNTSAGFLINYGFASIIRLDGIELPANATRIEFWISVDTVTIPGGGRFNYDLRAGVSTLGAALANHRYVHVETVNAGTSAGISISGA